MADTKIAYGTSTAYTLAGVGSLASSTTLTAGVESAAVDNTTNKYIDYLVGGYIRTGSVAPTAGKTIQIWVYGSFADSGTMYPDVIDGTNSAETFTSADMRNAGMVLLHSATVTTATDTPYYFAPRSVANCFGGVMPKYHGVFVVHDIGQNLDATDGDHVITYTPVYYTVA